MAEDASFWASGGADPSPPWHRAALPLTGGALLSAALGTGSGDGGGHMGRDPAPACTLPAALPAWHPQLPLLGPAPGVSHGCCAPPAPCPARGPHPVPWGGFSLVHTPSSPLPEGVRGGRTPSVVGRDPSQSPGFASPFLGGLAGKQWGCHPHHHGGGGSLAGGYRPSPDGRQPPHTSGQ